MDNIDVILIQPNDITNKLFFKKTSNQFDKNDILKYKTNYVDINKTIDYIKPYCYTKNIPYNDIMDYIVKLIAFDEEHYGNTIDCYISEEYSYQLIYNLTNEDDNNKIKHNLLASMLSMDKELIYGNAVLIKCNHDKKDENKDKLTSCNLNNIIELLGNNIYHMGVYVDINNNFEQIFFNKKMEILNDNFELRKDIKQIMLDKSYGYVEKEYLEFKLYFVVNNTSQDKINEPLTRLMKNIVRGDGILISPYNEMSYNDIYVKDVINLLKVNKLDLINENRNRTRYQILNNII